MRKKISVLFGALLSVCVIAGCGAKNSTFQLEIENFCNNISTLDEAINALSPSDEEETYSQNVNQLLKYLDILDDEFRKFDHISFPEDYSYLEDFAQKASEYMSEAVASYHKLFENDYSMDSAGFDQMEEYARENYLRAFRRVEIIIGVLQGNDPTTINAE